MARTLFQISAASAVAAWLLAPTIALHSQSGTKRTSEECKDDRECARGHCHQKMDGKKVCVDCSQSAISTLRGQIDRFCVTEPRGCTSTGTQELSESYFTIRIANGDRCIAARQGENRDCWNGGDQGHKDAVEIAERARKNCLDELNTRKGDGGIYTCSDSTFTSLAGETDQACGAVVRACEEWPKDDKVVECREIETAMARADKCVVAVERLDNDCLPRLNKIREAQFARGKRGYDYCKDVLSYKKSKALCK